MSVYTLVVDVDDGCSQDDLIAAVDGFEIDAGEGRARVVLLSCGPGPLVEGVADAGAGALER